MIRIFQICFDSNSFLSFYVDVSAEDFAKSVTQTFGKRVCLRVFCNFCTFQKDKKKTFSLFIIFVTCHDLVWQEMEQRAAWDSVDPKYPVKQIISLLMRLLLRDVMQYRTNSIL